MTEREDIIEPESGLLRLQDYFPYQLAVASNQVSRMVARHYQSRLGLTLWEWRVIAVLAEGRPISAQLLSEAAAMDKVTVSRTVKVLLDQELISRRRNETDRRSSLLSLTDKGQETYEKVAPLALKAEKALLEGEDEAELKRLVDLLNRLKTKAGSIDLE